MHIPHPFLFVVLLAATALLGYLAARAILTSNGRALFLPTLVVRFLFGVLALGCLLWNASLQGWLTLGGGQ